ncbi:unnamed protein product [Arctogadus glacialis]
MDPMTPPPAPAPGPCLVGEFGAAAGQHQEKQNKFKHRRDSSLCPGRHVQELYAGRAWVLSHMALAVPRGVSFLGAESPREERRGRGEEEGIGGAKEGRGGWEESGGGGGGEEKKAAPTRSNCTPKRSFQSSVTTAAEVERLFKNTRHESSQTETASALQVLRLSLLLEAGAGTDRRREGGKEENMVV